jgi:IS30 family transposase
MGIITKYSFEVRSRVLELAYKGYTTNEIVDLIGVSRNTFERWLKKDERFKKALVKIRAKMTRSVIETSLGKLAQGVEVREVIDEYYTENSSGEKVKRIVKTKQLPPNEKAIQILAQKYDAKFANNSNNLESNKNRIDININTSGMNLRELQENTKSSPLGAIEVDYTEIEK